MPNVQLVCLPFAGSGASFFRNSPPSAAVDLVPIQLPGREERFGEKPYSEMNLARAGVAETIAKTVDPQTSIALFGHSLGAVLAFEVARLLGPRVSHLFVSGSPDPWHPRSERASELSDEQFLAQVETFAGYSHPALAHPEMRQIVLPALRADVAMHENYLAEPGAVIAAPITALRGRDDALVAESDMRGWAQATSAEFALHTFAGGHMYIADHLDEVWQLVADTAVTQHA
ncbi:thioesterase II family protein [Nocardia sp. NPDC055029]